jgi:heme oxygenase-like protein
MSGAPHSQRLREKLELLLAPASRASTALWNHPRLAGLLPEYLFTVHCSARATIPLMTAARDRAAQMARADRVAAGLSEYLEQHITEELHHDEWFLEDLEALGVPRAQALARIPPPSVAAMVGSQYYWTLHYHPIALLGFLVVLEGYPASAKLLETAITRTRLPRRAFRTLLEHSDLDRDHRDELSRTLDALPLTPGQSALLAVSAFATLHFATCALEEVVQSAASHGGFGSPQLGAGGRSASSFASAPRTRATSSARTGSVAERRTR